MKISAVSGQDSISSETLRYYERTPPSPAKIWRMNYGQVVIAAQTWRQGAGVDSRPNNRGWGRFRDHGGRPR